ARRKLCGSFRFQAEDGIRARNVTGVQTCALPICHRGGDLLPGDKAYEVVKRGSGKQEIASTMALVRLLKDLMRDKETGKRWVPRSEERRVGKEWSWTLLREQND